MTHFRSRRKGRVYVELPAYAAGLIANLTRQLVELLSDGEPTAVAGEDPLEAMLDFEGPREAPDDPALQRLLPDAHRDDVEASAEFRRFTEHTLREAKIANAMVVLDSIGDVTDIGEGDLEFELSPAQARAWLQCLTDLRLTLATRLGVTADDDEFWDSLPDDDPRVGVHEIYGWLGFLLESLVDAAGY